MKTNIVKIAMTLALGVLLTSFVHGATNQLGKINNTSYIVTREDDPKFQAWKSADDFKWPASGTRGTFKVYPQDGIKGFFIGGVSLYDILRGGTNGLLSVEVDPLFYRWLGGTTIEFTNATPSTVKIGNTTVESLLDGKLDATNGVAYVDFKVYPTNVTMGASHLILTHESMSIGNTSWVEYKQDGITYNDESYEFSSNSDGIARLKDIKDETDPFFFAVFGNPILNLIPYDEINLVGTNIVTVTAPMFKVSNSIVVGKDNTVVVSNANIIGNSNRVGVKGWYYTGIQFTTNAAGVAQINRPATIYLTDDIAKRNTGTLEKDSSFVSGFKVGDPVCIVNNSKYDMECNVTAVDGNAITVDKIPFSEIATPPDLEYDDYTIISLGDSTLGCVEFSDSSFVAGIGNTVYRRAGAAFGRQNTVFGDYGFAEGRNNKVAYAAHAEGYGSDALAWYSHVEGFRNQALAWYAHAGGDDSKAKGYSSFAHGHQAVASGNGAVAFGGVYQYGSNGFAGGNASGQGSFAAGVKSTASGLVSVSIGSNTLASAKHSAAFGRDTKASNEGAFAAGISTTASGKYSVALGNGTEATGEGSVAIGTKSNSGETTKATKKGATAFGTATKALGDGTFAAGAVTEATNNYSAAFGYATKAYGNSSFAINSSTEASGKYSFAQGNGTKATNEYAAAFGASTKAYGSKSIAMGNGSTALGACSFSGGKDVRVNKNMSFGFGEQIDINGNWGSAFGARLQTTNDWESAFGYYNKTTKNSTRFSIGIGKSEEARTNAVEVLLNGKVYIKGVGNYDGTTVSGKQDLASVINTAIQEGGSAAKLLQIQEAAATAQESLNAASDIEGIKATLNTFFEAIK